METTCLFVCLSGSSYQRLNCLSHVHQIGYRSALQSLSSKSKFRENTLSDSHTLLKGLHEFSPVLSTFLGGSDELRCTGSTKICRVL
jgi:hypothetical protein